MGLGRGGKNSEGAGAQGVKEAGKVINAKGIKGVKEVIQSAGTVVGAVSGVAGTAASVASAAASAATSLGGHVQDTSRGEKMNPVEHVPASTLLDQVVASDTVDFAVSPGREVRTKDEL